MNMVGLKILKPTFETFLYLMTVPTTYWFFLTGITETCFSSDGNSFEDVFFLTRISLEDNIPDSLYFIF